MQINTFFIKNYYINKIKGQNTDDVLEILGYRQNTEVVHRDNMVVLG